MPSRKLEDGTYKDIAHPISNEFRQQLESLILDEFRRIVADAPVSAPVASEHGEEY
jgi:stage V sporulation protein G